jgi:hypothetical protein
MNRPLGALERSFVGLRPNLNCAVLVFSTPIAAASVLPAIPRLVKAHPVLHTFLSPDHLSFSSFDQRDWAGLVGLLVKVVDDDDGGDWRRRCGHEMAIGLPERPHAQGGYLWRLVVCREYMLFLYDHAAMDGTSKNGFVADLVTLMNGGEIEDRRPLPCLEDAWRAASPGIREGEVASAYAATREMIVGFTPSIPRCPTPAGVTPNPFFSGETGNLPEILSACRRNGTTVGAALLVSLARSLAHVTGAPDATYQFIVDMNERTKVGLDLHDLGLLIGFFRLRVAGGGGGTSFWAQCREVRDVLQRASLNSSAHVMANERLVNEGTDGPADIVFSSMGRAFAGQPPPGLRAMHHPGTDWAPAFARLVCLSQSVLQLTMDVVCESGDEAFAQAVQAKWLQTIEQCVNET